MTVAEYSEALTADEARLALREAAARDLAEHGDRETVYAVLDHIRRKMREQGREDAEDVVMDVMDYLVGYCNPRMAL